MARYQAGDFAAARELIHSLSPQLHRFFMAQFAARSDADDLLQETWLRIHRVRHTYRPGEPLLPWLYAIARHIRVDHYRKAIRTSLREEQLDDRASYPAAPRKETGSSDDFESLLQPLPESQREVLVMLKLGGMSLEEVARATSSTVGSVKQKVHRAYARLRKEFSAAGAPKRQSGEMT